MDATLTHAPSTHAPSTDEPAAAGCTAFGVAERAAGTGSIDGHPLKTAPASRNAEAIAAAMTTITNNVS